MSELLDNSARRKEVLKKVLRQLHAGRSVEEVKADFAALLRDVGAAEITQIEQELIAEGMPMEEIKHLCDVHVALFRESLEAQASPETVPGHPVYTYLAENGAAARVLDRLEEAVEALRSGPDPVRVEEVRARLAELRQYEVHYLREENILFPFLEKHDFTGPSSVMWAIHDDIRAAWKALDALLAEGPGDDPAAFAARLDEVFRPMATAMRELFYKEEKILFPTALEKLSGEEWWQIRLQSPEVGYCYVQPGNQWPPKEAALEAVQTVLGRMQGRRETVSTGLIHLSTGALTREEVDLLLTHLPVDVTYVDAEDRVRFFSQTRERIFPRSPAIVGRKVQQCHPPASVHRVQRILDDFRAGRRDVAEFWIQMKGRFIHIRYFALRDRQGKYRGTLEVTQDVTHIRALEGERRLLDEGE